MTTRNMSLEGGTNGATISTTNAASSGDTQFNTVTIPAGTLTFDNTVASQGSLSMKFAPASAQSVNARWTGISSTAFAASLYVYFTAGVSADLFIFNATAAGTTVARAVLTLTGGATKLRFTDTRGGTTPVWTATNAFPLNQWVRIEFGFTIANGTATFLGAYYLGDSSTPVDSINSGSGVTNAQTGTTAVDTFIVGKTDGSTYVTPFWIDGIQTNDASSALIGRWPATPQATVRPISVISNAGSFTNNGGAADIAAALADELDTTYAQSPDNPAATSAEVKFAPITAGLVTVKVRHVATAGSPLITRTYNLKQGSTVISTRSVALPTVATDYSFTTTSTEAANITDRTDLRLYWSDTV